MAIGLRLHNVLFLVPELSRMTRTPPKPSTRSLTTTLRKRKSPHRLVNAQHSIISQVWLNGFAQALANIITTSFPLTLASTIIHLSTGSSEGTISMQEGEVLSVVEEDKGDGWTRVRRNNGDEGYIPTSYATITLNKWPHSLPPAAAEMHYTKHYE